MSSDEVVLRPMTPLLLIITGKLGLLFFVGTEAFLGGAGDGYVF